MKRILFIALFCGYIGTMNAAGQLVNIKNNLAYGAATNVGGWKIANICTAGGGECKLGPISLGGIQVTPVPVNINVCQYSNSTDWDCQGVMLAPGGTTSLFLLDKVYLWASYNDGFKVKYTAPLKDNLEFPRDFEAVDYKNFQMVLR